MKSQWDQGFGSESRPPGPGVRAVAALAVFALALGLGYGLTILRHAAGRNSVATAVFWGSVAALTLYGIVIFRRIRRRRSPGPAEELVRRWSAEREAADADDGETGLSDPSTAPPPPEDSPELPPSA